MRSKVLLWYFPRSGLLKRKFKAIAVGQSQTDVERFSMPLAHLNIVGQKCEFGKFPYINQYLIIFGYIFPFSRLLK